MTIFCKELRSGAVSFLIWTTVVGGLMAVCVGMYPSFADSMGSVSELFAGMGDFSAAVWRRLTGWVRRNSAVWFPSSPASRPMAVRAA